MLKLCKTCGKEFEARQAYINYGRIPLYCSRPCSWEGRRLHRPRTELKALKAEYDRKRRAELRPILLEQKREAYRRDLKRWHAYQAKRRLDPEYRRYHRKYLASYWTPEKLARKSEYDKKYRAQRMFGPLWEAYCLTVLLNKEVKSRMSNYEIRLQNGTLNKAFNRSRNGQVKRGYT